MLNIADPTAPAVADIAACIAQHLGYEGRAKEVDDKGIHHRSAERRGPVPRPFVLDCRAALDLGYTQPQPTLMPSDPSAIGWSQQPATETGKTGSPSSQGIQETRLITKRRTHVQP